MMHEIGIKGPLSMKKALLLFLFLILIPGSVSGQARTIVCIKSSNAAPYKEAHEGFIQELKARNVAYRYIESGLNYKSGNSAEVSLVIAIGSKALEIAMREHKDIPVLFVMVVNPRISSPNVTGISLDIPPEAVFKTLKQILPNSKRIGVIYNPVQTRALFESGASKAGQFGLELVGVRIKGPEDVYGGIRSIIGKVDALWMLPDTTVYTPESSQDVLLVSLREKLPVIGLSTFYVKAGALFSLSCDYRDIGAQAAGLAESILSNGISGAAVLQPRKTEIAINLITAERIGIVFPESMIKEASNVYK